MGVPGAEQVRSISKQGLSIVSVVFDDAVPVYFARQLVSERLLEARGRIPDGLEPTLGPVATAFGEIYQYLLEGDAADAMAKKTLHDWEIRTRLRSVPGVSEINSWGGQTQQYQVRGRPAPARPLRADAARRCSQAIADNNASFGGGFIEHRSERYTVRGVGLAQLGGGHREHRRDARSRARRSTSATSREVSDRRDAAAGRGDARRQGRERRRHGHHAEGRERQGRGGPREGADRRDRRDAAPAV